MRIKVYYCARLTGQEGKMTLYEYCTLNGEYDLLAQWDRARNGALTPQGVSFGSHRRVWWHCEKGHIWQAPILARRNGGCGCPVCAGKQVSAGENDLASAFPEIAGEWHPTKNGELTPQSVTAYSNRSAWWICKQGHEYRATVAHRTHAGSGCPYCANRRVWPGYNDLATTFPALAEEWHPDLNGSLTPEMLTAGNHGKVWWRCKLGHVWRAAVFSRTGGKKCGCPICAGRTKTISYG